MQDNTALIAGIIVGNEQILKDFYTENMIYVRGYILRNRGNREDVEDVFQDALVILYQQLLSEVLELKGPVKTYFYGICKNIWRNKLRNKLKLILTDNIYYFDQNADTSFLKTLEIGDREKLFRKHFEGLNFDKKRILNLYFEGNSMRKIADITGYSEKYARKKKFKVKSELWRKIEKDPYFEECMYT